MAIISSIHSAGAYLFRIGQFRGRGEERLESVPSTVETGRPDHQTIISATPLIGGSVVPWEKPNSVGPAIARGPKPEPGKNAEDRKPRIENGLPENMPASGRRRRTRKKEDARAADRRTLVCDAPALIEDAPRAPEGHLKPFAGAWETAALDR